MGKKRNDTSVGLSLWKILTELPDTYSVRGLSSYCITEDWLYGTENICCTSSKEPSNSMVSEKIPDVRTVSSKKSSKNNFHILIWYHPEKLYISLRETTYFTYLRAGPNKTHIILRPGYSMWLKRRISEVFHKLWPFFSHSKAAPTNSQRIWRKVFLHRLAVFSTSPL